MQFASITPEGERTHSAIIHSHSTADSRHFAVHNGDSGNSMLDVQQVHAKVLGNERGRSIVRINTDMTAAHRGGEDDVMRKKDSHIHGRRFQLIDWNNSNASSVKIMVDHGMVHTRMLLRHGSS